MHNSRIYLLLIHTCGHVYSLVLARLLIVTLLTVASPDRLEGAHRLLQNAAISVLVVAIKGVLHVVILSKLLACVGIVLSLHMPLIFYISSREMPS